MTWILVCPNCGTRNEVPKEAVTVKCGEALFLGKCINCKNELKGQQEYWRWLGLAEGLPPEDSAGQG
jgi:DNA-directed RNA polymerase subunit RPC12/RpoP